MSVPPAAATRAGRTVRLELHGPPRVVVDGTAHALPPRDAAVLAWLAVEGPTARERILELLWPSVGRIKAQAHLRQNLRRLKDRCPLELAFGEPLLQLAANVDCSVHDEIDSSDEALLRPPGSALLGDVFTSDWPAFDDWLQALRGIRAAERKRRIERRSVELEQGGDLDEALRFAFRLIADDPSDEAAHRRSMWLHFRRGDLAAARAAFDACRTALARTIRTPPGARTLELLDAIDRGTLAALPAFIVAPNLVRPPHLVGRDEACRAIDIAWQAGRSVLLLGDPGVGKSRLLADLAHRHETATPPVAARQGDTGIAYSLLGRLLGTLARTFGAPPAWARERLAGIVAAWGDAPSPAATTLQLRQALDATLDGWAGSGLRALVLDDLQYADESSLEWLVHAAGRKGAAPLRLLLAARLAELPPPLVALREAADSSVSVVELAPFDLRQVADLLDDLDLPGLDGADWSAALHALSGGVAFDLLNAVIALQSRGVRDFSGGPAALLDDAAPLPDAMLARLRRLADDALHLAQIAAIAGQDLEVDLAADLLRVPGVAIATPWKTLEQAGVFGPAGFVHDRILQAVDASIPEAVARSLHRQVAEWLARQSVAGTRATAARIATHWEAAERWAEAGRAFEDAAESARLRSARREEWQALTGAVRCHRRAEGDRSGAAFACECRRVRLMPGLRPLEEALACADALVDEADRSEDHAEALEARSIVRGERYDSEGALADALEARRLAMTPRLHLLASLQAARSLVRLGRHDEALRLFDVPPAELQALDPAERLLWLSETGTALDYADRRSDAIAAFDRAIEQGRAGRLWHGVNNALNDKAIALVFANRLEESNAALRDGIDCGRRAGYDDDGLLLDTMTLATNLRDLGRFDEALVLTEPLPAKLRQAGYGAWSHNAEHDLAGLFLWLGRPDLATRAMTPLAAEMPPVIHASRLFLQARLLRESAGMLSDKRSAAWVRQASEILRAAGGVGRSYPRLKIALDLARDDDPDVGAEMAARIEAEAGDREQHMLVVHARVLRVKLLLAGGRHAAAAEAARGLATVDVAGALYLPDVWWTASQALQTIDDALAGRCLDRAIGWIERVVEQHVPAVFRTSFLTRNQVNLAVRAAAARRR